MGCLPPSVVDDEGDGLSAAFPVPRTLVTVIAAVSVGHGLHGDVSEMKN